MRYHIVKTYVRQYERDLFALTPVDMSNKMLQPFLLTISKFFSTQIHAFSRIEEVNNHPCEAAYYLLVVE